MRRQIFAEFLLHHRFVIGPVAEVHLRLGVVFEDDQMRADSIEEPAVVTHNQRNACKFADGFFQSTKRVHIQVVGGFVEEDDVGAFGEGLGEVDAVAFTT